MKAWLRDVAGIGVPITAGGVLIGRGSACTIVVDDPSVSRRHALVIAGVGFVQVVPMSKSGVVVRGEVVNEVTRVSHGDEIAAGSARFIVESSASDSAKWQLAAGGRRYLVERSGFTLGGAEGADLVILGWPERAGVFHPLDDVLLFETGDPPVVDVIGAERDEGFFVLAPGARIAHRGTELVVRVAGEAAVTVERTHFPTEVILEFVPRGALLRVKLAEHHTAFLPQRRGELVAALLRPGAAPTAGEWIDDDTLVSRVWGREGASRTQLNVLIHRARQSLTQAGLNGPALVERAPGGGGTRFRIADGAQVTLI